MSRVSHYLTNVHRQVKKNIKENVLSLCASNSAMSLLDCGCEDGTFSMRVARKVGAKRVVGLDVMDVNVQRAISNGVEAYQHDLNKKMSLPDNTFDVAIANEVIEFLLNTDGFVKELYWVLKPGGYLIVSTTNIASWHSIVLLALGRQPPAIPVSTEMSTGWERLDEGIPIPAGSARALRANKVFTLAALKGLLQYHGFTIEKVIASGYYPLPMKLARIVSRMDKTHSAYVTVRARKQS
jgi:SAM-dependent methyltransferase